MGQTGGSRLPGKSKTVLKANTTAVMGQSRMQIVASIGSKFGANQQNGYSENPGRFSLFVLYP